MNILKTGLAIHKIALVLPEESFNLIKGELNYIEEEFTSLYNKLEDIKNLQYIEVEGISGELVSRNDVINIIEREDYEKCN